MRNIEGTQNRTNAIDLLIQRHSGLPGPQRLHPRHDPRGNLIDDGVHHYTWDGYDHLIGIAYHGHPQWQTTMAHDGLDHLVTITEKDGQDIHTQHLLWCGEAICGITDDHGQLLTRLFDQGEWHQGQARYTTKDHLGSIRDVLGLLPPANELIHLQSHDYSPYGETLGQGRRPGDGGLGRRGADGLGRGDNTEPDGSAAEQARRQARRQAALQTTLGYAGMFHHARSGLYLTHYRAYDPRLGRWLSRDPIGERGGINLYAYAWNNPLNYTDPTGQCPLCAALVVEAALGVGIDVALQLLDNGGNLNCIDWGQAAASGLGGMAGPTLGSLSKAVTALGVARGAGRIPKVGDKVYRVWGGGSGPYGRSWSRTNPRTVANYRDSAGLPNQNSGRFVTEGTLTNTEGATYREALQLHGNKGGLDEVVIPDPANQISIDRVSGANPEF